MDKDGKRNGLGSFTDPNGTEYVGELKDGLPNGQGSLTRVGEIYIGEFKIGKCYCRQIYFLQKKRKVLH